MRWGLWMSPIINSFLRQSPDPTWYNQDGAVRTVVAIGADIGLSGRRFSRFQPDDLPRPARLRLAARTDLVRSYGSARGELVNLSFLGGDRADEAAGRFLGYGARTRAIPDGIRRFGDLGAAADPVLHSARRRLGQGLDRRRDAVARRRRCRARCETLAVAYAIAGVGIVATSALIASAIAREARRRRPVARRRARRAGGTAAPLSFNNGAVGVEIWRDGRGAAIVMGEERGGFPIDLIRRPLDPLQSRGQFFYRQRGGRGALVDRLRAGAPRGRISVEETGFNRVEIANVFGGVRATMEVAPDAEGAVVELAHPARRHIRQAAPAAPDQLLRDRRRTKPAPTPAISISPACMSRRFSCAASTRFSRATVCCARRAPHRGETSFFAVQAGRRASNSSATRIRARASSARARSPAPTGCEPMRWRKLDDEGKLWTFDPAASFTLEVALAANGEAEIEFIIGRADNAVWASDLIAQRLDLPPIARARVAELALSKRRAVEPTFALALALAVRLLARRHDTASDPSHAAPLGACDGQRSRRQRDGRPTTARSIPPSATRARTA